MYHQCSKAYFRKGKLSILFFLHKYEPTLLITLLKTDFVGTSSQWFRLSVPSGAERWARWLHLIHLLCLLSFLLRSAHKKDMLYFEMCFSLFLPLELKNNLMHRWYLDPQKYVFGLKTFWNIDLNLSKSLLILTTFPGMYSIYSFQQP